MPSLSVCVLVCLVCLRDNVFREVDHEDDGGRGFPLSGVEGVVMVGG